MFNKREFDLELKINKCQSSKEFVQDNILVSSFGVLRGLHYQPSVMSKPNFSEYLSDRFTILLSI